MKKAVLSISIILSAFLGFTQDGSELGRYQIEVLDRSKPSIPYEIDQIVKENRKRDQVVYISIGTHCRIKILPMNEIEKSSFLPLEKQYVNVLNF